MSLLEWMGESMDPGETGEVSFGAEERPPPPVSAIIVCFIISTILLGLWFWLMFGVFRISSWTGIVATLVGTLVYLVLAYNVTINPDYDNIGWFGGLFDHPFRYSDDINRTLIFFKIILWPGRFVATSYVDMAVICFGGKEPPRRKKRKKRKKKPEEFSHLDGQSS
jgi:hypothetical protein